MITVKTFRFRWHYQIGVISQAVIYRPALPSTSKLLTKLHLAAKMLECARIQYVDITLKHILLKNLINMNAGILMQLVSETFSPCTNCVKKISHTNKR